MTPTLPFTAKPAGIRRPVLGAVLIVFGVGVPLGVLLLTMTGAYRTTFGAAAPVTFADRLVQGLLMFALLVASVVAGRRIVGIGAALRQPDALTVLTVDYRRPVLYLRSFDDDAVPDTTESVIPLGAVQTFEMRLTRAFRDVGPVISIGRPGERLPELGTSRIYVANDAWQRAVQYFLEQAAAVVVLVGRSTGVTWEIQTALATVPREKLLFAFPFLLPRAVRRGRWARERIRPRGRGDDRVSTALLAELRREQEARYVSFRERFGMLFDVNLPDRLEGEVFLDFLADVPRLLPRREPLFIRRRRDSQGITLDYIRTLRPFIEKLQGRTIPPDATERFFTSRGALAALTGACATLAVVLFVTPFWAGFSPAGVAVFFLNLVPANLAYWGLWNFLRQTHRSTTGSASVAESWIGPWLAGALARLIAAATVGGIGAVGAVIAYTAGTLPERPEEALGALAAAVVDGSGGAIAGLIAGLRGDRWRSMLLITVIGEAAVMVAARLAGVPFDAPETLDVGDLLVLAFPFLAIAGAIRPWFRR